MCIRRPSRPAGHRAASLQAVRLALSRPDFASEARVLRRPEFHALTHVKNQPITIPLDGIWMVRDDETGCEALAPERRRDRKNHDQPRSGRPRPDRFARGRRLLLEPDRPDPHGDPQPACDARAGGQRDGDAPRTGARPAALFASRISKRRARRNERLNIQVLGLASIATDVSPELALGHDRHRSWCSARFTLHPRSRRRWPIESASAAWPLNSTTGTTMMKLNEGFLTSMNEAIALLRDGGPAEATDSDSARAARRADRRWPAHAATPTSVDMRQRATTRCDAIDPRAPQARLAPARARRRRRGSRALQHAHATRTPPGSATTSSTCRRATAASRCRSIVMLHGCTQDADDFAAGTQMNALAEAPRLHRRVSDPAAGRESVEMLELVQAGRSASATRASRR